MRRFLFALLALTLSADAFAAGSQKYFLTPQRLRRLKRDRERQTPRWVNFENRVNSVRDSPERGLELALYYAITGDVKRGEEALAWERANHCLYHQAILIRRWVDLPTDDSRTPILDCTYPNLQNASIAELRDDLLLTLKAGKEPKPESAARVIKSLESGSYSNGNDLYAAIEFLTLWREASRTDAREQSPQFFSALPTLLLLAQKPEAIEHPTWQMHIAALALVALDPNSTGAQFLQGWAIEDRQMLHDGPGVLYELLWADPYLPGVGYQNLDPWLYNEASGTFFARADWSPGACWVSISPAAKDEVNCPQNWASKPTHFGRLNLVPFDEKCMEVKQSSNETTIFSGLTPGQKLRYDDGGDKKQNATVNPPGLWRVPPTINGRVCASR